MRVSYVVTLDHVAGEEALPANLVEMALIIGLEEQVGHLVERVGVQALRPLPRADGEERPDGQRTWIGAGEEPVVTKPVGPR